jgi:hypothetical protein
MRLSRAGIGVGLAALCGLVVAPAVAAERPVTLRFVQIRTSQSSLDLGSKGRSLGDVVVMTNDPRGQRALPASPGSCA